MAVRAGTSTGGRLPVRVEDSNRVFVKFNEVMIEYSQNVIESHIQITPIRSIR
jgi:hypothetical protein